MDRAGTVTPSAQWDCLAHDLVAQGIGVASYDDRGLGESSGRPSDSFDGRTDDALAVATWVAARPEVGSLYLLGHSEGAAHASAAAQTLHPAGLVLVAGMAGTGEEMWIEQGRVYLEGLGFPEAQVTAFVEGREAIAEQLRSGDYSDDEFGGLPIEGFWAPFLEADGTALALAAEAPVLIVQGGKDWQVPAHHGDDLYAALQGRDVALAEFPDLGHLMQPAIGPVPCGLEYHLPWSWDPPVTAAIAEWIAGRENAR
jgi:alpha-beta hydrolase superfamily lysophospholipase